MSGAVRGGVVQAHHIGHVTVTGPAASSAGGQAARRWPRRFGVVPPLAHCFQSRAETELLPDAGRGDMAAGDPTCAVVFGLGGVGKTQLAAAYAERMWTEQAVDLLVWVAADSRAAIASAYVDVAAELTGTWSPDADQGAERFLVWLAESTVRWLIVLDDVQAPTDLDRFWPPRTASGRVLVTTRRRDAALAGHGRRLVDVGVFTSAESAAYLAAKLDTAPGTRAADLLADDLGHLPLALAQAAAYIVDEDIGFGEYRARLADQRHALADLVPEPDALPDSHRATMAATWSLSIHRADSLRPAGMARPILELASLMDPNGVPVGVFTSKAVASSLGTVDDPAGVEQIRSALQCLHRLSLATVDMTSPHSAVRVHALVQRATREKLADHRLQSLSHLAADALLEVWPAFEQDTTLVQALRANTDTVHRHAGDRLWTPELHQVLCRVAASYRASRLTTTAIDRFQHLHDVAEQRFGPGHPRALCARRDLIDVHSATAEFNAAVLALEHLLADATQALGPDHAETLATRHLLAFRRGVGGDLPGAIAGFTALLSDNLRLFGPDHPETMVSRSHLAWCRGEAGDMAGAVAAFEQLLADRLRVLGPHHESTLTTRGLLARARGTAGDPAAAVSGLQELLDDVQRLVGPYHPGAFAVRIHLASWLGRAGDPAAAVAELEQLLHDQRGSLGPEHSDTLSTRCDLARWRIEAGDLAAVTELEQLLDEQCGSQGSEHPDTRHTRVTLAEARQRANGELGAGDTPEPGGPTGVHGAQMQTHRY
ncbi:FxSxx-COOH system tetratricopeptide repeat protein [Actinocrispum wychmicini]|nr:FxSxx-COOH system tetratricopeptide repeat protein [Actinocrispum wychmicini]